MQLLHSIRDHLYHYRAGWAPGLLCLILLGYRYSGTARAVLKSRQVFRIVQGLGLVLTLTYALTAILYLLYPNYIDHFEATVSAISWLGTHGHLIYPDWQTGDIYEAPYGPLLFMTNGAVLRLFPTIFGSKLAGWTAFLTALALTYITLKAKALDGRKIAFLFFMILIATFSFVHDDAHAFWSRAEPFLILIVVLSVIAALTLPEAVAAITIGILAGLAIDFKLHGALYAVPAAVAVFGAGKSWRDRIGLATLLSIGAAIVATLPFLLNSGGKGSTVEGYISVILIAANHGLNLSLLIDNLLFALLLFAPIIFTLHFRRPALDAFDSWFLGGLFVSLAMTTIVASKPGAGTHHFLPLVPISVYVLLSVLEAPASRPAPEFNARVVGTMVLVSLLVSYAPGELQWTRNFARKFRMLQTEKTKIDELQAIHSQYIRAEVGLSDDGHYGDTFYRSFLVFQGAPLHIDFAAWMDLAYAGVSETRIIGFLKQCDVPVWILPEGAPFTQINYYTQLPLLSDEFRRTFFANYHLIQRGEFYQVWRC